MINDPVPPPSPPLPEERPESSPSPVVPSPKTWPERIFPAPHADRLGRLLLYLGTGFAVFYLMLLLGTMFFSGTVSDPAALWQDLYQEIALLLGAVLPAFLMGHLEERSIDDYGLPRRQAFGKLFWTGAMWGLAAITVLLLVMRGAHILYFGHLALHGARILRFAVFWGVFYLVVALFEDFLFRGYMLFTLAQSTGFWPASVILSCAFGAVHLRNPGEGWVGALGAAAIGFFFCLTLRRTGNLWFAIGFHAAWDWGETYLYAVPNSGTYEPGHLLSATFHGPTWLTGGTVGPEGSVLCFTLLVLLGMVFHRAYPRAGYKEPVS